jgi:hypothetical protein
VFLVAVELAFRAAAPSFFLAIDQHDYATEDTLDYTAVGLAIDLLPPADVLIMGTSRAREAIQSPELSAALTRSLRRPVSVRNYGVAAGRADTWLVLGERLIDAGKLPRVIAIALDASDFRDLEPWPQRLRFVDLWHIGRELSRNGWMTEGDVSQVIGNSIPLRIVEARPTLWYRLISRGERRGRAALATNAAFGGTTSWAREYQASLVGRNNPPIMKWSRARFRQVVRAYTVRPERLDRLDRLTSMLTSRGVRVVLAELPTSPQIRDNPRIVGARRELAAALAGLADRPCLSVIGADRSQDLLDVREFRDPSHLNARGATAFAAFLEPFVRAQLSTPPCGGRG